MGDISLSNDINDTSDPVVQVRLSRAGGYLAFSLCDATGDERLNIVGPKGSTLQKTYHDVGVFWRFRGSSLRLYIPARKSAL